MKILYYLDSFPKISETFILNEVVELEELGHEVVVCALTSPNKNLQHQEVEDLESPVHHVSFNSSENLIRTIPTALLHLSSQSRLDYSAPLKDKVANQLRAADCIQFLQEIDWEPDLIHSHFATVSKFGGYYLSNHFEAPFTITTHAYDIFEEPIGEHTMDLLNRSTRIITISEYNKEYLNSELGIETNVDIVHAGINPQKFDFEDSSTDGRVLTVCRLVEKKGVEYAIDAVGRLVDQGINIDYRIVGSGPLEKDLKEKVENTGLSGNVTFLSNITDSDLVKEFREARCFLLPCVVSESGDRDGIPVVLMESMASGTPPVSTEVSGIPELVSHRHDGLLSEPKDVATISSLLYEALEDDALMRNLSKNGREKIQAEFNIKTESDKLEKALTTAVDHS